MSLTLNLRKKVHRKIWEPVFTPAPVTSAAGTIFVGDHLNLGQTEGLVPNLPTDVGRQAYYVTGVSAIYWYNKQEEAFAQLPNSGSAGTYGAGAAGFVHPVGPSFTASAGTTNSFTSTLTMARNVGGYRFRVTAGTNRGLEGFIRANAVGANAVFSTVDTYAVAFDNTSVIQLFTGRFWLYVPGATSGFNYYDYATNAWTSRSVASGPAITANEGCLIGTPAKETVVELGTASAGAASTLTDATRSWEVNCFARRMVTIISGTGAGQYRYVVSNTATILTVDAAWGTAPDATSEYEISGLWSDVASAGSTTTITAGTGTPWTASQWIGQQVRAVAGTGAGQTSVITANTTSALTFGAVTTAFDSTTRYVIEPDDNAFWFLGGAAVTLFKYSISGNTWATISPVAARGGAAGAGTSGSWIANVPDIAWNGAGSAGGPGGVLRQNGRFIYSFRAAGASTLDVYDIAANTWYSGITYVGSETFTTGSTWADWNGTIYGQKDATGRFFMFNVAKNEMVPLTTNNITQSTAISGARLLFDKYYDPTNGKSLNFITYLSNTSAQLQRMVLI
jgi:hypothetical protein